MKTQTKTHKLRRFLCGLTAMATAALMVPMAAMAAKTDGNVTIDKTATPLSNENQTTVTLDVQAGTTTQGSDVVFVLDKSTSLNVSAEAEAMLNELMEQADENSIKVGVVVFNKVVNNDYVLQLTELNDSTQATINEYLNKRTSSGTNIEAGIRAGIQMLQNDTSVPNSNKHLVLVTDGATYLWGTGETPKSIYSESASNGEETLNAGNELWANHHPDTAAYNLEFNNIKAWYDNHSSYADDIATYQHDYVAGQYPADKKGQTTNSTYINSGFQDGQYIPAEIVSEHASANDAAVYQAVTAWAEAYNYGFNLYAYADDKYSSSYPWSTAFVGSLNTVGGYSTIFNNSSTQVEGMFDNVRDTILYTIENGTVTDIIGTDFNFAGVDTVTMSVNGVQYVGSVNNNQIDFYAPNGIETVPHSTVVYNSNQNGNEVLTWNIQSKVSGSVSLSYKLNLDPNSPNIPTGGDSATLPTNVNADLNYTGSDGNHTIVFPVPTVTIGSEPETSEPVIPSNPSLTIRKIWENDDISTRPSSITVDIYRDGLYIDSIELYERYGWRDSYEISERYEDADWWVVESDVPSYYDSDVEEVRDNVFYITNTYEEPVIETPVTSEPESSEPSSEPSEVTPSGPSEEPSGPSGPSVEPSTPSSEPSSESAQPAQPAEPTLPQTGQLWWPVPALLACGALMVAVGAFKHKRGNSRHER